MMKGLEGQSATTELVQMAINDKLDAKTIVINALTCPMEIVGAKFDKGEYLIPDMLASAECLSAAMDLLGPHLAGAGVESKATFVLATVACDLHNIGKIIVGIMLKGAGFNVLDLGYYLRKLEMELQPGTGMGHSLCGIFEICSGIICNG
jgi:5-methyltetrahydrofolate--homocysteine methyltransferase